MVDVYQLSGVLCILVVVWLLGLAYLEYKGWW